MRKRLELAAVTSGHLVNDLYAAFLTPLLPMLVAKFDMSLAVAGLLSAVYAITSSVVQPLVGHLADTTKSRAFIVLGPTVTATAMCMIGLAGSQGLLVALLVIGGIGSGMFHPQGAAMAGSIDQTRKGFVLSVFTTAGEVGYALGPLVVLSVVSTLGLRYTYVTVIPGILVSLFIYRFAPRRRTASRPGLGEARRSHPAPANDASAADGALTSSGQSGKVPVGALVMLWIIAALRLAVSMSYTTFLPIYLKEIGLPLMVYGSVASVFVAAGIVGIMVAGPAADRMGPFKLMIAGLLAPIPLLLGFMRANGLASYALLAAAGFTIYLPMPIITMTAQNLAPARAGTVSAFMMGVAWGAGSLGAAGIGVVADALGIRTALTLLPGVKSEQIGRAHV